MTQANTQTLTPFLNRGAFKILISYAPEEATDETTNALDLSTAVTDWGYTPPKEQDELIGEGYYDTEDDEDADEEEMSEEQELAVADMGHLLLITQVSRDVLLDYHKLRTSPHVSVEVQYYTTDGSTRIFKHVFEGFVDPVFPTASSDNFLLTTPLDLEINLRVLANMWCLE